MPVNRKNFVPYCVEQEIRLGTFVPQSLRKEHKGKSELLKEDLFVPERIKEEPVVPFD